MATEKAQNVQDVFLNHVRKSKTPVTVFLVNGVKLQGIITWFDNFSVLLRRDGHTQLVYKHAISTVMPGAPIQLFDATKAEASTAPSNSGTLGLAREVAEEGIRVVAVRPGFIDTEMHDATGEAGRKERYRQLLPMKRLGTPEEVAAAILWMISGEASYVSGTVLDVAGAR